jgi:hypothetical protein
MRKISPEDFGGDATMPIDIDSLTAEELVELNHRIVARLRFLRQLEAHATMLEFRIGERVTFHPPGRAPVTGVITRYNQKTVSLVTEAGERWNVAPHLLTRMRTPTQGHRRRGEVIDLPLEGEAS